MWPEWNEQEEVSREFSSYADGSKYESPSSDVTEDVREGLLVSLQDLN